MEVSKRTDGIIQVKVQKHPKERWKFLTVGDQKREMEMSDSRGSEARQKKIGIQKGG